MLRPLMMCIALATAPLTVSAATFTYDGDAVQELDYWQQVRAYGGAYPETAERRDAVLQFTFDHEAQTDTVYSDSNALSSTGTAMDVAVSLHVIDDTGDVVRSTSLINDMLFFRIAIATDSLGRVASWDIWGLIEGSGGSDYFDMTLTEDGARVRSAYAHEPAPAPVAFATFALFSTASSNDCCDNAGVDKELAPGAWQSEAELVSTPLPSSAVLILMSIAGLAALRRRAS